MIGIGFNAYIHDTAAALLVDGKTVAFAEQERFNRDKHTTSFPDMAIKYCLDAAGATWKDVDYVAFYWDPWAGFFRRMGQTLQNFPGSIRPLFSHQLDNFSRMRSVEGIFRRKYHFTGNFYYVNHYLAHAAHAAYRSPFESSAILVLDGNGEIATSWLGKLDGHGRIEKLHEVYYPHSLGLVWCAITEYLGYMQNCDEGKVMGLSAYGDECMVEAFRQIIDYRGGGDYHVDLSYFDYHTSRKRWYSQKFVDIFGPARNRGGRLTDRHLSLAHALQATTEELLKLIVADLLAMTGERDLCYTGGVALNCVANGKLHQNTLLRDIFIPPASNDAGTAEGAALYVYHMLYRGKERYQRETPYLGPEYSNDEIEAVLKAEGLPYRKCEDVAAETAKLLVEGKIVGWFQGRMETGPRALGNRSILADPRPDRMKDHINAQVKHREWYRPFGPSVLAEHAGELFETGGRPSPYMLMAFDVLHNWRGKIPAVEHVDGTARIQTVTRQQNQRYYDLIKHFDALTGVPTILNTSFNVMGEPIVRSPQNAVDCFRSTGIDVLSIGDFICEKTKA